MLFIACLSAAEVSQATIRQVKKEHKYKESKINIITVTKLQNKIEHDQKPLVATGWKQPEC